MLQVKQQAAKPGVGEVTTEIYFTFWLHIEPVCVCMHVCSLWMMHFYSLYVWIDWIVCLLSRIFSFKVIGGASKPGGRKKDEDVDTSPLLQNSNLKNQRSIDEQKLKVFFFNIMYIKAGTWWKIINYKFLFCHIMTFFSGFKMELYNSKRRICGFAERSDDSCQCK